MDYKIILDILSKKIPLTEITILTVISAIFVVIIGFIISIIISRYLKRIFKKADMSPIFIEFISKVAKALVIIFSLATAIGFFGIDLGAAVISVSVVSGFIFGFAFQDTLGNLAAGFMIVLNKPFTVNDYVEIGDIKGSILDVGASTTTIKTYDCKKVIIPNAKVWGEPITNYTAFKERMIDLTMSISYDDDIKKSINVIKEVLLSHPKILDDPEPYVNIKELADSSIDLMIRPWVKKENYMEVKRELMILIMDKFDKEGINVPYNQIDINILNNKTDI